jgi:very-short-patch-repair endonuclease
MSRLSEHNKEVMASAEYRAGEMKVWPSPLEEKMKGFLKKYNIPFEEQKIFYITADDGWIIRYYIADFYIPGKKIIIEVDGKFHDNQKQKDKCRTKNIQKSYPGIEVLRFTWKDLNDKDAMEELLWKLFQI